MIKSFFNLENDIYVCHCYIPPENSRLYLTVDNLRNFDFFDCISEDVRYFSGIGDVYMCGDLNSRCGHLSDRVDQLGLDRYVNLPDEDEHSYTVGPRASSDERVNIFGRKLISLCKEHDMVIMNGRLEQGRFTCFTQSGASVVDYFIAQTKNVQQVYDMYVSDLTEFSDHCFLAISININNKQTANIDKTFETFDWESAESNLLLDALEAKREEFDSATEAICNDDSKIDGNIILLTDVIYNACFSVFGRTVKIKKQSECKRKPATWFNDQCRTSKGIFLQAKRTFKSSNSEENKVAFLDARRSFVQAKRKAKRKFSNDQKFELSELGKSAPKKFWKKVNQFRNKKVSMTGDLSVGEFQEHFHRIMNNQNLGGHDRSYIFPENNIQVEELDKHISESEVLKAIHSLKRGKSPGFDGILGDFFIDAKDFMVPYLVIIYNKIYESGVYPESWCKGLIVPIHKRGDRNDPNNYRGIMLISVFAKLFSLILRNRLNTWCEDNEVLNEFQFGFRVGRSTSDGIFILHSLVQHVLKDNGKLYCAFIDYEKAFDTVIHEALWLKLVENGISCKFTRILQSLYGKVLAAVKIQSDVSSFFDIALGVKQGEPLSPLLFILFINDVYADLKNADNGGEVTGISINHICFFLLLFADDMILFTKSPTELQTLLNKLQKYSTEWGLRVNTKKTKICIFENRRSQHNQLWYYDGEPLDIVDSFCYLGMKFHKNGNLEPGVKALSEQALKAANQLLALSKRMSFDVKTKLKLFDSLVSPILLYASEVWGIYEYEHIDKIHIKLCKNILGVRTQSPNYAVYGDLGRYPLCYSKGKVN